MYGTEQIQLCACMYVCAVKYADSMDNESLKFHNLVKGIFSEIFREVFRGSSAV